MDTEKQRQIEEDHRLALELSGFPTSSRDIEENGYVPIEYREASVATPSHNQQHHQSAGFGFGLFSAKQDRHTDDSFPDAGVMEGGFDDLATDDWTLARTLQAFEFEIANEMDGEEFETEDERDFRAKEVNASGCRRQMITFSTFIVVAQLAIFIASTRIEGMAPAEQNPMYGPPVVVLVRFGAKEASLQVYDGEWWRMVSAIMLHGGVWHLLPNLFIQLRVGGYLNLVFGTPMWTLIYFISGIFGYMVSSIFSKDTVGVGSSGALLGMLTAWIVWIIFRWRKIPDRFRSQRNCQLFIVVASVVITLGTSFAPYVDWGAHFGGAIQGVLWGIILLSKELDNSTTRNAVRLVAFFISAGLIVYAAFYLAYSVHPSIDLLDYFHDNDDWNNNDRA